MTDPNVTYKTAYAELRESLGRLPTANELLPLHEDYKGSYSRERDERVAAERLAARLERVSEPLGATDKPAPPAPAVSEPGPPANKPRLPDGLSEGDRGPGGGIVGKCVKCKGLFERPARKGRPPIRCEECR